MSHGPGRRSPCRRGWTRPADGATMSESSAGHRSSAPRQSRALSHKHRRSFCARRAPRGTRDLSPLVSPKVLAGVNRARRCGLFSLARLPWRADSRPRPRLPLGPTRRRLLEPVRAPTPALSRTRPIGRHVARPALSLAGGAIPDSPTATTTSFPCPFMQVGTCSRTAHTWLRLRGPVSQSN